MILFDRSIRVEFSGVDVKPITDLRVAFEVDKNDGLKFNHGLITIDNLQAKDRLKIARPHPLDFPMIDPVVSVSLYVGYKGKEVLILTGDILSAVNVKRGATWKTEIDVYSGLGDTVKGRVQLSFATPTSAKTIANQIFSNLGIDVKYTPEAIERLTNKTVNDFSCSGMATEQASVFLARYGLSFTIESQNQGLVYVKNRPRNPQEQRNNNNLFSPENGLIGTPEINRRGIELKAFLRPGLKLFEKIFVQSATTTGTLQASDYSPEYHIVSMKHFGDNRGADWFTEISGVYTSLSSGVY